MSRLHFYGAMMFTASSDAIEIKLKQSYTVACTPNLKSLTTFTLLEQERWFEKEIDFVEKFISEGMTVIDIGANVGVYSLLCAKKCGETGHVYSYDPNPDMTSLLRKRVIVNKLKNITVREFGVSDAMGETNLIVGSDSEWGRIGSDELGQKIALTSLDEEMEHFGWDRIDFMKIDAEGVEEKIIAGADKFFANLSPVVMIEVQAEGFNLAPIEMLEKYDFAFFRQLGRLPVLVPADLDDLDPYELNIFAVPKCRILELEQANLLVSDLRYWSATADDARHALQFWQSKWYIKDLPIEAQVFRHPQYQMSMIAYACWADELGDLSRRVDALCFALMALRDLCQMEPSKTRLISLARLEFEFGNRSKALSNLWAVLEDFNSVVIDEVFCAPSEYSETSGPRSSFQEWLHISCAEQCQYSANAVVFIARLRLEPLNNYRIIDSYKYRSLRTARTRVLLEILNDHPLRVPDDLKVASKDHLNAQYWNETLLRMV